MPMFQLEGLSSVWQEHAAEELDLSGTNLEKENRPIRLAGLAVFVIGNLIDSGSRRGRDSDLGGLGNAGEQELPKDDVLEFFARKPKLE